MKIISFAWTSVPLLARRKTRTRRQWDDNYAATFKLGETVQAYDRSPRFKGKRIALIKILSLEKQDISLLAEEDYEKEGFKYMEEQGLKMPGRFANQSPRIAFNQWRNAGGEYWVVDFEFLSKENEAR
jgi:hypothetical protein